MIARLRVKTPFVLCIPAGAQFKAFEADLRDYKVRFYPPMTSTVFANQQEEAKAIINGMEAASARVIQIDFIAEGFNRTIDHASPRSMDPSVEVIRQVLDSLLAKLRRITIGSQILPLQFPNCNWYLQYLRDDGSDLSPEEGKSRGKGYCQIVGGAIGLTEIVWDKIETLPVDYIPPAWETLLLDASHPGIPAGSAIVLAFTALEVYVSQILDTLAKKQTNPLGLQDWKKKRHDRRRRPSVEEQYGVLLKIYCGHSLKEDSRLWQAFIDLRHARNRFAHNGIIDAKSAGKIVPFAALVASAREIMERIDPWLPEELHWEMPNNEIQLQYVQRLCPF